ncbi:GGDEF-domain containing protein [Longispora fulva]|uniref:Diguanylate cyclase (GGDEF)-like protein n=1 Tax=Longispora fulva TaxID=619741 RepID=A0A8J7GUH1_9ACTN|nr:EAL domain-containing protein [Longispora fulva]MBG6138689.1 diguanylate cyclase (GGDEF)-like protein [Longispora fulva]GIG58182.1 GGDEF-domain containing protein [Longispora fulva]
MEPTSLRNTAPPGRRLAFFGYLGLVILAAIAVVVPAAIEQGTPLLSLPGTYWLMFALACAADARPFNATGPRQSVAVFPSVCFAFAALLIWGLPAAVLVQASATLVFAWRMRHSFWRGLFNVGQYTLALSAAYGILSLAPVIPLRDGTVTRHDVVLLLVACSVWFAVSHGLVATAVWLRFGGSWRQTLTTTVGSEGLAAFALLLLGPFLVAAAQTSGWLIPLIVVPLYAVYRTARLSQEHERLSLLDPLTGLANRKALFTGVEEAIAALREIPAHAQDRRLALIVLDLDRFKQVNDALGHAVGDRLLIEVGRRLAGCVPADAVVARLGGDEFAVLAPRIADVEAAQALATTISVALNDPVRLDGMPLDVASSIGIALSPDHGDDFTTLLRHADVAMYDAKTRGDTVAVYVPESDHNSPARLGLLGDLRRSLETPGFGEVALYYQPQVDMSSGEVVGVEALLRWRHPVRGLVSPEELIKVAEHSGVMRLLTYRVIDEVLAQLARWAEGGMQLRAAINVSVRDLHTTDLVDYLAERLAEYGVAADQIQLEITEGALMADPRRVLATLQRLDRLGVALSLDDFGTGYSSLQHLRRLPLSEVKIDRSFVLGMSTDEDDASIVRSIIELAGALGLRVVAEGVEDERTWRWLVAHGCHVAQGWFYARPMPADELPRWLAKYRPPMLLRAVPNQPEAAS